MCWEFEGGVRAAVDAGWFEPVVGALAAWFLFFFSFFCSSFSQDCNQLCSPRKGWKDESVRPWSQDKPRSLPKPCSFGSGKSPEIKQRHLSLDQALGRLPSPLLPLHLLVTAPDVCPLLFLHPLSLSTFTDCLSFASHDSPSPTPSLQPYPLHPSSPPRSFWLSSVAPPTALANLPEFHLSSLTLSHLHMCSLTAAARTIRLCSCCCAHRIPGQHYPSLCSWFNPTYVPNLCNCCCMYMR